MRIPSFRLCRHCVLRLVDSQLSVIIHVFRKIRYAGIRDRDLLAIRHGCECIIKTVWRPIVRIRAAVPADLHIVIENDRISGDDVSHIYIRTTPICSNRYRVVENPGMLVIFSRLCRVCLTALRFFKYNMPYNIFAELDSGRIVIEYSIKYESKTYICGCCKSVVITVALIELYFQKAVCSQMVAGSDLIRLSFIHDIDIHSV